MADLKVANAVPVALSAGAMVVTYLPTVASPIAGPTAGFPVPLKGALGNDEREHAAVLLADLGQERGGGARVHLPDQCLRVRGQHGGHLGLVGRLARGDVDGLYDRAAELGERGLERRRTHGGIWRIKPNLAGGHPRYPSYEPRRCRRVEMVTAITSTPP